MSRRICAACVVFLFFAGSKSLAQLIETDDHLGSGFLQSQVSVGFSAASDRSLQNTSGWLDLNTAFLRAVVPVFYYRVTSVDGSSVYFVLARGHFSPLYSEISFLPSIQTSYQASAGVTAGIATTGHHLYLLTIDGGFSENDKSIDHPQVRPTGSLMGKYHLDDSFAFLYGLSYSYTFGRGLVVPLLGTHCSLARDLNLHLVLPYSLEINYQEVPALRFGLVIRANGDQVHIEKADGLTSPSSPIFVKMSGIQGAVDVSFELTNNMWLRGEAGILRNRNIAVGPLKSDILSTGIENSGYSTLTLVYDFGESVS
jgi:hypothetical protein